MSQGSVNSGDNAGMPIEKRKAYLTNLNNLANTQNFNSAPPENGLAIPFQR